MIKDNLFFILLLLGLTPEIIVKADKELDLNFYQNDYKVKFERVELAEYNKNAIDISIFTYKFNRSTPVVNVTATFKLDMGNDMHFIVQAYSFLSNEYRVFPVHFAGNACKGLRANVGGIGKVREVGNFTGCPILRGKYHFGNWSPDESKLPPFIPNGKYKIEIQFVYLSTNIATVNAYAEVYRPIFYN